MSLRTYPDAPIAMLVNGHSPARMDLEILQINIVDINRVYREGKISALLWFIFLCVFILTRRTHEISASAKRKSPHETRYL